MSKTDDDKNSVCSDDEQTNETVIIKDKKVKKNKVNIVNEDDVEKNKVDCQNDDEDDEDEDDEDNEDDENEEDEEDEDEEDEEDEDEEDEEEEDDDDDDDDNNEFDTTIIQFEMMKNFFIDKEGENISTHLGSISHELRKLNKIAVKLLEKKS